MLMSSSVYLTNDCQKFILSNYKTIETKMKPAAIITLLFCAIFLIFVEDISCCCGKAYGGNTNGRCNGKGKCNIFCCNCDNGCKPKCNEAQKMARYCLNGECRVNNDGSTYCLCLSPYDGERCQFLRP